MIAHNVRSTHNVGSLLRTADGLGLQAVYLTGYTPYPIHANDERMPHESAKLTRQIHKTALGAEETVKWQSVPDIKIVIKQLKNNGYSICSLEQAEQFVELSKYSAPEKVAVIVGNEVTGVDDELLKISDTVLEIPMNGKKESFNVVQAAAMALYHLRFM